MQQGNMKTNEERQKAKNMFRKCVFFRLHSYYKINIDVYK